MPSGSILVHRLVNLVLLPIHLPLRVYRKTSQLILYGITLTRSIMSGIFDALFGSLGERGLKEGGKVKQTIGGDRPVSFPSPSNIPHALTKSLAQC